MEYKGCCEYCGQSKLIEAEEGLSQAEYDALVTDQCDCPQAKSEKRKRETAEKVDEYINTEVSPSARDVFRAAVEAVKGFLIDSITIVDNDGWRTKISVDKDGYLVFDPKKTISKKTKF